MLRCRAKHSWPEGCRCPLCPARTEKARRQCKHYRLGFGKDVVTESSNPCCCCASQSAHLCMFMSRVGQNFISPLYMTVCMVISLPKIPYIHRKYLTMYGSGHPYLCLCRCGPHAVHSVQQSFLLLRIPRKVRTCVCLCLCRCEPHAVHSVQQSFLLLRIPQSAHLCTFVSL